MPQVSQAQVDRSAVRALSAMVRPGLGLNVWRVNVLLVEDDAADTRLIQRVLKRHRDVGEVVARNLPGKALLELAAGRLRPTLILLDISMPRVDGFQFLEALRRIPSMEEVPVVFLTTSGLSRDVQRASRTSACGYIVKPDTYEELETRIDSVIKQAVAGLKRR